MRLALAVAQGQALSELRAHLGVARFVLVGAAALKAHVDLGRTTSDVDLAIVIEPNQVATLMQELGWLPDQRMAQRWHHPHGALADVLPAPSHLVAAGGVTLKPGGEYMSLIGFDLAFQHALPMSLPDGTDINVASLATIVVLKMVAWLDRPQERQKDLADLVSIFEYALADDDERRWDEAHPLAQNGLEHEDQSAFFAGHEVRSIAGSRHVEQIERFLRAVEEPESMGFAQMLRQARYPDDDPDSRLLRRLAAFRLGLGLRKRSDPRGAVR